MADKDGDYFGMKGFGFADIDAALRPANPEEEAAAALAQYEHAKQYADCFNTPAGRYVLNDMMQLALMGPRFDATPFTIPGKDGSRPVDGLTMAFQGFYREGSACWYHHVAALMRRAEQGPPVVRDSEPQQPKRRGR